MTEEQQAPDAFWDNIEDVELPPFMESDEKAHLADSGGTFHITNVRTGVNNFGKDSWYLDVMFPDAVDDADRFRTISLETGNYQRDNTIKQIERYMSEHADATIPAKLTKEGRAYYIARP